MALSAAWLSVKITTPVFAIRHRHRRSRKLSLMIPSAISTARNSAAYTVAMPFISMSVLTRFPDIRLPQLPPDSRSRRCKTAAARLQRFLLDVEHPCTRSTLADYLYEIVSAMVCCNAICDYFLHIIEQFAVSSR